MAKKKYLDASGLVDNPVLTSLIYFIFQGMRYMTPGERLFKMSVSIFAAVVLYWAGISFPLAVFLAHTLNFCINSQIPVLLRYVVSDPGLSRLKVESILDKLLVAKQRSYVGEILIYGSFCRGGMTSSSDIDVRLFHYGGALNSLRAYFLALRLRFWSNIHNVPIDLFCFSDPGFLDKLSTEEVPAIFGGEINQRLSTLAYQSVETCLQRIELSNE